MKPELWAPPNDWDKQDAFLIGGGPSLTGFDFGLLRGRNVIGCNDAFHLGAEVVRYCIFGDASWWQKNKWELEVYTGKIVTNSPTCLNFRVRNMLKMLRERDGLHSGTTLGWNYSTGAAAINLAVSLGAVRIFLLGYDLNNGKQGSHWHKYNQKHIYEYAYKRFTNGFNRLKQDLPSGVSVLNVTDGTSRLDCFSKLELSNFKTWLAHGGPFPAMQTPANPLKAQAGQAVDLPVTCATA